MRVFILTCVGLFLSACSTTSAPQSGTLLTFTRSGGFAGFDDTLVVAHDGGLTLTDKLKNVRQVNVKPETLAPLDSLVRGAEFRTLAPSYTAEGADLMTYTVSVPGVAKVLTMDAAQHPAVLDKVLAEINGLLGRIK